MRSSQLQGLVLALLVASLSYGVVATSEVAGMTSAPTLTISPTVGPPTTKLLVSARGLDPNTSADIYFDLTDVALATTNAAGEFSNVPISVPASAVPGTHGVTAVSRVQFGKSAATSFLVRTNWAQFQFNANHTGSNRYENVLSPTTVPHIGVHWSYFGGGFGSSQPAVVNGVVYVGNDDGNLYALKAGTGALLWKYTTGSFISSSPAVFKGVVYISSSDGYLYAVKATTGALLWKYAAGGSSPAVYSTSLASTPYAVYVVSGAYLFALNATTGALLWKSSLPRGGPFYRELGPAVADGVVYTVDDFDAYAFDAITGSQLWVHPTFNESRGSPIVHDGMVYIPTSGYIDAVDAKTGILRWSVSSCEVQPAVSGGVLYTADCFDDITLVAHKASNGAFLWCQLLASGAIFARTSISVANGVVYTASANAGLEAFKVGTGQPLWQYLNGYPQFPAAAPVVADGVLYAGFFYEYPVGVGTFHAFDLFGGSYPTSMSPPQRPDPGTLVPDLNLQPSTPLPSLLATSQAAEE